MAGEVYPTPFALCSMLSALSPLFAHLPKFVPSHLLLSSLL